MERDHFWLDRIIFPAMCVLRRGLAQPSMTVSFGGGAHAVMRMRESGNRWNCIPFVIRVGRPLPRSLAGWLQSTCITQRFSFFSFRDVSPLISRMSAGEGASREGPYRHDQCPGRGRACVRVSECRRWHAVTSYDLSLGLLSEVGSTLEGGGERKMEGRKKIAFAVR